MKELTVSASPHLTNKANSTKRIMCDVLIALAPCFIAAIYFYGYHVIINTVICLISCAGAELLYNLIISKNWTKNGIKQSSIFDLSFAVTAVILALNLPAVMTVANWGLNIKNGAGTIVFSFDSVILCIIGSFFAIMIVKMLFGGVGKNFANPALCGRILLFIAFSSAFANTAAHGIGLNATSGATWLGTKQALNGSLLFDMFVGNTATAAVGETCVIAILLGFIYLSIRKVINFQYPLIIIASCAFFVLIFDALPSGGGAGAVFSKLGAHIMSGGLIFGAVFMATDYSTTPNTVTGNIIFAVGVGLITALIRAFGGLPEGFSFALLIMNLVVPLIDKYIIPKPFGFVKAKKRKIQKRR